MPHLLYADVPQLRGDPFLGPAIGGVAGTADAAPEDGLDPVVDLLFGWDERGARDIALCSATISASRVWCLSAVSVSIQQRCRRGELISTLRQASRSASCATARR